MTIIASKPNHFDYELLSKAIYQYFSSDSATRQQLEVQLGQIGYSIDRLFDDKVTSFQAVGLVSRNPTRPPVLVFQGTVSSVDSVDGVNPRGVGFNQFNGNKNEVKAWIDSIISDKTKNPGGQRLDLTGHSLGGALTQWFISEYPNSIGEAITFQSPGIAKAASANFINNGGQASQIFHYVVNGDFVSLAGEAFLPGTLRIGDYQTEVIDPEAYRNKHLAAILNPRAYSIQVTGEISETLENFNKSTFSFTGKDWQDLLDKLKVVNSSLAASGSSRAAGEAKRVSSTSYYSLLAEIDTALRDASLSDPPNRPPVVVNPIVSQNITLGTAFNFTFPANTFSDPDAGSTLTYAATLTDSNTLPTWLTFDANTRTFSGTPPTGITTPLSLRVTARDGGNLSVSDDFDLTLLPAGKELPTIAISTIDSNASEPNKPGQFTLTRTGTTTAALTVNYTISGTATNETDYAKLTGTVTFQAGQDKAVINVNAIDDNLYEGNETVTITIDEDATKYTLDPNKSASLAIADNETKPTISVANISQSEGNSGTTNYAFELKLSNPSVETITVKYATANDTATAGSDYTTTTGTVTFNPGETSKTVNVEVKGDELYEANETFKLNLTEAVNATLVNTSATGTITNDDLPNLKQPNSGTFQLNGENLSLQTNLSLAKSAYVNEIAAINLTPLGGKLDLTTVAGIKAFLDNAKVAFSNIANSPNGFVQNDVTKTNFGFGTSDSVEFAVIKNSTIDTWRAQLAKLPTTADAATLQKFITDFNEGILLSTNTTKTKIDTETDRYSIKFEDGSGDLNDYQDIVINTQATTATTTPGAVENVLVEIVDLKEFTAAEINASFSIYREAAYNNHVGFYKIDNVDGSINGIKPGDAGYTQAAINNLLMGKDGKTIDLSVANQQVGKLDTTIVDKSLIAPIIAVDTTFEALKANPTTGKAYFSYLGANSGGEDRIRFLGDMTWGFEDLTDMDYNDVIVKADFKV
jgi:hypothetical protein